MKHRSEYATWWDAKRRCTNENHHAFKSYGGRGIRMCERWMNDWRLFVQDMGERPPGMTLERKDNNAGYSPENCIWANRRSQQNNTRQNRRITLNGITRTLTGWARALRIDKTTLFSRLKRGIPLKRALSKGRLRPTYPNGRPPMSEDHKRAISASLKGKPKRRTSCTDTAQS